MPVGSPADRDDEVAVVSGTMHTVNGSRAVVTDMDFTGFTDDPPGSDGRILVLNNAPGSIVHNCIFRPGDDDSLTIYGDSRGTVVSNCQTIVTDYETSLHNTLLSNGSTIAGGGSDTTERLGADVGYAGTFVQCTFQGSNRVTGGVWNFIDCEIEVGALYGVDAYGASINFIRCNFVTISQPGSAPYWYNVSGACPVRISEYTGGLGIDTKVYFKDCTLNDVAKTGQELCRLYDAEDGYTAAGLVPLRHIVTSPITESVA